VTAAGDDLRPGSVEAVELLGALREWAAELGLERLAVASPDRRPEATLLDEWLARGDHAGMGYLARRRELRLDPDRFLPGVRSIVCAAWAYDRAGAMEAPRPGATSGGALRIARFAWGRDYHVELRRRLRALVARLRARLPALKARVAVDTAPVLERHWAAQAGLGWIGRHGCLIVPGLGSWVFLGEIFLDLPLPAGAPLAAACGECRRCLEACPGGALREGRPMDARRCVSYWTVEHSGAFPRRGVPKLSPWLFGCDACQEACPWNAGGAGSREPVAPGLADALHWTAEDWERLGAEGFAGRCSETPLARAGYANILRNARRIAGRE